MDPGVEVDELGPVEPWPDGDEGIDPTDEADKLGPADELADEVESSELGEKDGTRLLL